MGKVRQLDAKLPDTDAASSESAGGKCGAIGICNGATGCVTGCACRAALLALLGALPTRGQEVCETTGALTHYGGSLQQMTPWRHTMFLIILVVVVFVLGFCAGRLSLKTNMRTVRTQSQVTYRRDLATPRFAPLGDKDHGGWAE